MKISDSQPKQPASQARSHQPFFGAGAATGFFSKQQQSSKPFFVPSDVAVQAKLTVGAVGDRYEQEADAVADRVVTQINQPQAQPNDVQREAIPEKEDRLQAKPMLQRIGPEGGAVSGDIESKIQQARGGGQAIAPTLQAQMSAAMGADFSGVRIHTDAQSDQLNQSIQAKAFTTRQDVFFRQGEYQPQSHSGQKLIAHELAHVVQQNRGRIQREPVQTGWNQWTSSLDRTQEFKSKNEAIAWEEGQKPADTVQPAANPTMLPTASAQNSLPKAWGGATVEKLMAPLRKEQKEQGRQQEQALIAQNRQQKWRAKQREVTQVMSEFIPSIEKLDPDAEVRVRGSLATGVKLNPNKQGLFNPEDFDIDAYVVSDTLYREIVEKHPDIAAQGSVSGRGHPELKIIIEKMADALAKIEGNRDKAKRDRWRFNVTIRSTKKAREVQQKDADSMKARNAPWQGDMLIPRPAEKRSKQ